MKIFIAAFHVFLVSHGVALAAAKDATKNDVPHFRGRSLSPSSLCTPAPKTGCYQSPNVKFEIEEEDVEWKWTSDNGSTISVGDGDSVVLCVYDGAAVEQTETQAPTGGSNSLVLELSADADVNTASTKLEVEAEDVDLTSLASINLDLVISQVQSPSDGSCYGAPVSVTLRNPPAFNIPGLCEPGTCLFDESKAQGLLNDLAALYNEKFGADGPLDMTFWSNALAATELQNLVVTEDLLSLDTAALASALYVLGWYGGSLFQRDGFSAAPPPGIENPNFGLLGFAQFIFGGGFATSLGGTEAEVQAFLTSPAAGGPTGLSGTGLKALVDDFGYNTGYAYAVLRDDTATFNPPVDKLQCAGVSDYASFPFPVPRMAALFDCSFELSFLDSRIGLRSLFDEYTQAGNPNVAALPAFLQPSALAQAQSGIEQTGIFIWEKNTPALIDLVLEDQDYRESLWDIDNAFLEVIEAAAALAAGALARDDMNGLGRKAVLASVVLKGWLISYTFGLTAPGQLPNDPTTDPRVLPLFNLGTTPIVVE